MNDSLDGVRLGDIAYANSLPVYEAILNGRLPFSGSIVSRHPSDLNEMLALNQLDISPISSIEYARHQDDYFLLKNLCINSKGAVLSVLLLSKVPIHQLKSKKVGLTQSSASARALVQILLEEFYELGCEYLDVPKEKCGKLEGVDAELIIGDAAFIYKECAPYSYDLAEEWLKKTSQPVVFAVWAVRKDFFNIRKDAALRVSRLLCESYELSKTYRKEILEKAIDCLHTSEEETLTYFKALGFCFTNEMQNALLFYYEKASQMGFCPPCKKLEFING